jgi:hypothetical protein
MYLHATRMISPEREALGVVDVWMLTRKLSVEQAAKLTPVPITKKAAIRAARSTSATSEVGQSSVTDAATETAAAKEQATVKESARWI